MYKSQLNEEKKRSISFVIETRLQYKGEGKKWLWYRVRRRERNVTNFNQDGSVVHTQWISIRSFVTDLKRRSKRFLGAAAPSLRRDEPKRRMHYTEILACCDLPADYQLGERVSCSAIELSPSHFPKNNTMIAQSVHVRTPAARTAPPPPRWSPQGQASPQLTQLFFY